MTTICGAYAICSFAERLTLNHQVCAAFKAFSCIREIRDGGVGGGESVHMNVEYSVERLL